MRIALIMLAAGNSRRFGGNKLLYEIDAREKPSKSRQLHVRMIVKNQKPKGLFHSLNPNPAHIMIIAGINKINSSR